jgi:hypothetical protein
MPLTNAEKQEELKRKLISRTISGDLKWTPDAQVDSFSAVLTSQYLVRIRWPESDTEAVFMIVDSNGQIIVSETEGLAEPSKNIMSLWHAAKDSALGVNEALDDILKSLS